MSGLDKIKDSIISDARKQADENIKAAESEAGDIKSKAVREAGQIKDEIEARSKRDVADYKERVDSSLDMTRRVRLLEAKQEMIDDVITEAKRKVTSLDTKEYFSLVLKLVEQNATAEEGEIIFSGKDLARLPEGFSGKIEEAAASKGGKLSISRTPGDIKSGFILSYNGIEENMSFEAMFEAKKDDLTDIVRTILFS
jgi:V/A-type H+-transporting ATPase subunit E